MKRSRAPRHRSSAAAPFAVFAALLALSLAPAAGATTYYVSSSTGDDGNAGTSPGSPFETIARVNAQNLAPGDQVRFFCGDVWRAERLVVTDSGTAGQPITFTSHPLACADRPVVSGAQPIVGWVLDAGNVYRADLGAGGNAGRFPGGVNQLFEGGGRLPYGRWPNLGTANGGYSTIDAQSGGTITDNQLPAGNWTGAYFQYRGDMWYLVRRAVVGDSGSVLTLNTPAQCPNGCVGWGFFLNHHRATLDQDGEWFYDAALNRVYVVSTSGPPANGAIEGSVVGTLPVNDDQSGVVLGTNVPNGDVAHVVIDNLDVRRWAANGIQMSRQLRDDDNEFVTLRNNRVADAARFGIRLTSFVFQADVGPNGTRGGRDGLVQNNLVEGANVDGIEMYSVDTVVERNVIRDIGRLADLTDEGLGCPIDSNACAIHGNGLTLRVEDEDWSGSGNTVRLNRLERIGWTGIDVYGPFNLIEHNVVVEAASILAEGAGVRTFGGNDFASTKAHDITIRENVVHSTIGNVDGVPPPRGDHLWGFGVSVTHFTDDVDVVGNTVSGCTAYGVNFAFSRGTTTDNTLWDNSTGTSGNHHFRFIDGVTRATFLRNTVYALVPNRAVMSVDVLANLLAADDNYYFNPYDDRLVRAGEISNIAMTLPNWQATSGFDGNSRQAWFSLPDGVPDNSVLFVNETEATVTVPLAEPHLDLDQNVVTGSFQLAPFASRILIAPDNVVFADGFESGDTSAWTTTVGG